VSQRVHRLFFDIEMENGLTAILPLPAGEGRGEGELLLSHLCASACHIPDGG
jgi:hypothetical protein